MDWENSTLESKEMRIEREAKRKERKKKGQSVAREPRARPVGRQ